MFTGKRSHLLVFTRQTHSILVWHELDCKNVSLGICRQRKLRLACTSMHSDQDLHGQLAKSLDTKECISGEQRPRCDFAQMQDYLTVQFVNVQSHFLLMQPI